MIPPSIHNKKRISQEEYNQLSEHEKNKFKFQLLDEDFSPGPGDDVCFTYRVQQSGLAIAIAPFWVDHHRCNEQHQNDRIEYIKTRNAGYFRKKHGLLPYWEPHTINGLPIILEHRTSKIHGCYDNGKISSPETCAFIVETTKSFAENDIYIDCGANTGLMSVLVPEMRKIKVICYEPNTEIIDILQNNSYLNSLLGNSYVVRTAALYNKKIPYSLMVRQDYIGCSNIEKDETSHNHTVILDEDIIDEVGLKEQEHIRLIKIDCENSTPNVLAGAHNTIEKHKPIIIIETHDMNDFTFIKSLGYKFHKQIEENEIWLPPTLA